MEGNMLSNLNNARRDKNEIHDGDKLNIKIHLNTIDQNNKNFLYVIYSCLFFNNKVRM